MRDGADYTGGPSAVAVGSGSRPRFFKWATENSRGRISIPGRLRSWQFIDEIQRILNIHDHRYLKIFM